MSEPFRGSEAIAEGRLTKPQLRGRGWRRLFRDVYIRSDAEVSHLVMCRAAALAIGGNAVVSGTSAAFLHGADVLAPNAPVQVTVGRQVRSQPGLEIRRAHLSAGDIVCLHGLRVTSLTRTAFDLARWYEQTDAVVALDALLTLNKLSLSEVVDYARRRRSWRGTRQLCATLALAAPGAESPMESRLRLVLVRAGLPTPALQHRVYDDHGWFVARLDLAYVLPRLGIEYDGGCHFDALAARRDLRRQNALRAAGWSLFRFTADDVVRRPHRLAAQVRAALDPMCR